VRPGDACVIVGWSLGREGRKLHAATALFGPDGRLRARARQTWLTIG
jgi:predicted amidohydrolase